MKVTGPVVSTSRTTASPPNVSILLPEISICVADVPGDAQDDSETSQLPTTPPGRDRATAGCAVARTGITRARQSFESILDSLSVEDRLENASAGDLVQREERKPLPLWLELKRAAFRAALFVVQSVMMKRT
jgi:hypothetical protein